MIDLIFPASVVYLRERATRAAFEQILTIQQTDEQVEQAKVDRSTRAKAAEVVVGPNVLQVIEEVVMIANNNMGWQLAGWPAGPLDSLRADDHGHADNVDSRAKAAEAVVCPIVLQVIEEVIKIANDATDQRLLAGWPAGLLDSRKEDDAEAADADDRNYYNRRGEIVDTVTAIDAEAEKENERNNY